MKKRTKTKKKGRPSDYRADFAKQVFNLCLLGAIDEEIAKFFGVSFQTINTWKKKHPQFLESIKRGKTEADAVIAESLYHRARGYSHPAVKIFNNEGRPLIVPYTENFPPDTTAAIFFLKNRQPKNWRDMARVELSGKDGESLFGKLMDDVHDYWLNKYKKTKGH